MARAFASSSDLGRKKIVFEKLTANAYAYSAEGDPTSGVVIGDDGVMVIDTRSTPVAAEDLIRRIRRVTRKPIKYVVLSHYHAVRVLGASAYRSVSTGVKQGHSLKQVYDRATRTLDKRFGQWEIFDHCMPFDISRCYDEASGIADPRIWTAKRDLEMWQALESGS